MRPLVIALLLASAVPAFGQEVRVGVVGPMTGTFGEFGAELRAGVEAAVRDLTGAGTVAVEVADDRCNADTARAEANRLVDSGVVAVIGGVCFQAALAAAAVFADAGIPFVSPGVQNPRLTAERAGPFVFRLGPSEEEPGVLLGEALATRFPTGRIAIVSDRSGAAAALVGTAEAAYRAAGGEPVYTGDFEPGAPDYALVAGRLNLETVDAALVAGAAADVGRIAAALAALEPEVEIFTGEEGFSDTLIEAAGEGAARVRVVAPVDARLRPENADIVARFRAEGVEPDGFVLPAYAAFQVVEGALAAAGGGSGEAPAGAVQAEGLATAIGPVTFDDRGEMVEPGYTIYRIEAGDFVPE